MTQRCERPELGGRKAVKRKPVRIEEVSTRRLNVYTLEVVSFVNALQNLTDSRVGGQDHIRYLEVARRIAEKHPNVNYFKTELQEYDDALKMVAQGE